MYTWHWNTGNGERAVWLLPNKHALCLEAIKSTSWAPWASV